jgi:hypothetical protein
MEHASWNGKSLARFQLYDPVFEVDVERSVYDIKEFVFFVVLVPVEFAANYAKTDPPLSFTSQSVWLNHSCVTSERIFSISINFRNPYATRN